jgi:hypothetical protein
MTSPIDAWKAIAKFHEEQLLIAKNKIQEMEAPAKAETKKPVNELLTDDEINKRVLALETRSDYAFGWSRAIDRGLVENVQDILEDCYDSYLESDNMAVDFIAKAKQRMGKLGSAKWQLFTLDVIALLKKHGSFDQDSNEFDCFDDTAGGCDEITWDAGIAVINNTTMPTAPPAAAISLTHAILPL